jgi:hypothetical protein
VGSIRASRAEEPRRRDSSTGQRTISERDRVQQQQRNDQRWLERRRAKFRAAGHDSITFARAQWQESATMEGDPSGRAAWMYLARCKNRVAVGAIRRAAFAGGRTWSNPRTIHIINLGLAIVANAAATRRKGKWRNCIEGVPREAFAKLLRNPHTLHVPSITALTGVHRSDGDLDNGQIGYLTALERAGLLYRQQLRRCADDPSCNLYWVASHSAYVGGDQLAELLQLIEDSYTLERPPSRAPP